MKHACVIYIQSEEQIPLLHKNENLLKYSVESRRKFSTGFPDRFAKKEPS